MAQLTFTEIYANTSFNTVAIIRLTHELGKLLVFRNSSKRVILHQLFIIEIEKKRVQSTVKNKFHCLCINNVLPPCNSSLLYPILCQRDDLPEGHQIDANAHMRKKFFFHHFTNGDILQ